MKVNRTELLTALQIVGKAVNSKPLIPLFGNVLVEVEGTDMRLSATDYELGIKTNLVVKGKESFEAAVPAKLVTDFVNILQDEEIEVKFDKVSQQMTFKTDSSKNAFNCVPANDFPQIPEPGNDFFSVPTALFSKSILRTAFCAANLQTVLSGVFMTITAQKLILFATDGLHLSYDEIQLDKKYKNFKFTAVIPASRLETISRILNAADLQISQTDNQVRFRCGSTSIVTQKLEGQFPDYKMFQPAKPNTKVSVSSLQFLRACKQVELFVDGGGKTIFNVSGMLVNLSTNSKEKGNSAVNLPCIVEGSSIALGINVSLMKQILEICNENTTVCIVDGKSPVVFRMEEFPAFYHFIMPMEL